MTSPLTFLFTDLENSTPIWEKHPDYMQDVSSRHDILLRETIEANRGRVVKTTGDGFHAVFDSAVEGTIAALESQRALLAENWPEAIGPLKVRMGLHTGESQLRNDDYYGSEVNRAARVMDIANGGQVIVSEVTAALIRKNLPPRISLADLGEHRLKGIAASERIFQVCHPDLPVEFPPLKSLSAYKHNLHRQLSNFIGREKELANVKRLLKDNQLLTMLGPGGTGKTRLMLQVAEEVIQDYPDGVWLVELAPLTDPDLIPERVASALDVQEQHGREMLSTLAGYLRNKELLLLLDNVEHVVRESAEFAEHLLVHCPNLKILVTGREALFIDGETTIQIPSLSLPDTRGDPSLEIVCSSEAVQLFFNRAQAVRPDFDLNAQNAATIAEITHRLDGIPLALELAAARLRMLTVDQIAERLSDRFRLLTGGRRTALPRQQTLQAMIDWSWNLLDDKECILLRRLSVFSGGWTLEAVQGVTRDDQLDEFEIFDSLEQLINKSLVRVEHPLEGEARYDMLESIRQYARDRLFEAGEGETLRNRHALYFVGLAEEATAHLGYAADPQWIDRIISELDNIRNVLTWTQEDRPDLALRICGSLINYDTYWLTPREIRLWLEPLIEKSRPLLEDDVAGVKKADFIRSLLGLGWAYSNQGLFDLGISTFEEAIRIARGTEETRLLAMGLAAKNGALRFAHTPENLPSRSLQEVEQAIAISRRNGYMSELFWALAVAGQIHSQQGNLELGMRCFTEATEIAQEFNSPRGNAASLLIQSRFADIDGDFESAIETRNLAIEALRTVKDQHTIQIVQSELAHIHRRQGDLEEAEAYYRRTIVGWQEQGHQSAVAHQLECFAFLAIARGEVQLAARLLGSAQEARQKLDSESTDPQEVAELAQALEQLAEAMGEAERDRAMDAGRLVSLDEAVDLALIGTA